MSTVLIYPKNKKQESLVLDFLEQNKMKSNVIKNKSKVYIPFKDFADELLNELDKQYQKKEK